MDARRHQAEIDAVVDVVLQSRKYRTVDFCEDTLRDLVAQELPRHSHQADVVKAVKRKLHNVIASYLGDADYLAAERRLVEAFRMPDRESVRNACAHILMQHASTRERLAELSDFYGRIFEVTGQPQVLLDIACGLNPLSFPWMALPNTTAYHAYDIRRERVAFLNRYFVLQGLRPLAHAQDVLVSFPQEEGDIALILKEVHRFEQRGKGRSLPLIDALRVPHVVVSFPRTSLHGQRDLGTGYRELLKNMMAKRPWRITEIDCSCELVFCIEKAA